MRILRWILFGTPPYGSQYYANKGLHWIHRLSRKQIDQVFSHEDLLYRLTEGQLAALGERLLVLEKEESKSFTEWFLTLGDVPEDA